MKKMVLAMVASIMMSMVAMAQDGEKKEARKFDRTEMVKQRTDMTVKRLGLNEEQAAKLLELNTRYMGKMGGPMMGRGQRPGRMNKADLQTARSHEKVDSLKPFEKKDSLQRPGGRMRSMEDGRKVREAYDAELKQILTQEQYEQYKTDEKKMFQGRRMQGNRQRAHKNE